MGIVVYNQNGYCQNSNGKALPSEVKARINEGYDARINYQETAESFGSLAMGQGTHLTTIFGKDPVNGKSNRRIEVSVYSEESSLRSDGNWIVVMPPTGGENFMDRSYARHLYARGTSVALVRSWEFDNEASIDLSMHDNGALRALVAVMHVLNYISEKNPKSISILGTSVGSLTSILALGYDIRIKKGVLITAGIGFVDIIAESDEKNTRQLKEARAKAFGFKDEKSYKDELKKKVKFEMADFIGQSGHKETLLVVAKQDTTVPTRLQNLLETLIVPRKVIRIDANHTSAIFKTYWEHFDQVIDFLTK